MKRSSTRYEWWAMTSAMLLTLTVAATVALPPYIGADTEIVFCFIPGILLMLFCGCVGGFYLAVVHRRPWLMMTLVVGISYVNGRIVCSQEIERKLWTKRFERQWTELERAVDWARRQTTPSDRESVVLPPSLSHVAERGRVMVHKEEDGAVWYAFPVATHGIDNSIGFVWGPVRRPPPRLAFPELVRSMPLENGWWLFWST